MEAAGRTSSRHPNDNETAAPMKPQTATATAHRPNRVLIALAAAWMILSLALGGVVSAGTSFETADPAAPVEGSSQP
jgi:hypothetical protein